MVYAQISAKAVFKNSKVMKAFALKGGVAYSSSNGRVEFDNC